MKFSIITVTFNASSCLENTILNVIGQVEVEYEYIIIDGGSTDGTVDIIRKYESQIAYWVSQPDRGLYDAMNKGLEKASGDYVCFMNAGDTFYERETLKYILDGLPEAEGPDIIYGQTVIRDTSGKLVGLRRLKVPEHLTWRSFRWGMLVCHQAFIVKRGIAPLYDLQYRLAADFDWCIRCLKEAKSVYNTHQILASFLEDGISSRNRSKGLKERYRIMCRYYGRFRVSVLHIWFALRFYFAKWFIGRI